MEKVYVYKAHANGQLYSSIYMTREERYCDMCHATDEEIAGPFESYTVADEWISKQEKENN